MKRALSVLVAALVFLLSVPVADAAYSNLFVFGDSLSDSGNNAIVLAPNFTPVPISGNSFIPTFPYISGRYTNDKVWAEYLAASLGLSASPSLIPGGTDWAFGGARTGPLSADLLNPFPPSLLTQVAFFLAQHGNVAPGDALYVVAGGGDNGRDAFVNAGACGGNFACINAVIQAAAVGFAADIAAIDAELELAGAERLVVWDVPDFGKAPAVLALGVQASALGTLIATSMNLALLGAIAGDPDVQLFDIFGLEESILADPGAFGLTNVTDACAQFITCDPSRFLFWDGIHPTSAGHLIIANAIFEQIPEPATLLLLAAGLAMLAAWARPRRRAHITT